GVERKHRCDRLATGRAAPSAGWPLTEMDSPARIPKSHCGRNPFTHRPGKLEAFCQTLAAGVDTEATNDELETRASRGPRAPSLQAFDLTVDQHAQKALPLQLDEAFVCPALGPRQRDRQQEGLSRLATDEQVHRGLGPQPTHRADIATAP